VRRLPRARRPACRIERRERLARARAARLDRLPSDGALAGLREVPEVQREGARGSGEATDAQTMVAKLDPWK
jgi:hypothetical protein